ncbi:MAG: hypothetical protein Q8922_02910 [Bacteroidota bacterium]|nr:hypothetical protein [Bacteroidota bacterium]MDP4232916.1 hypothetical protein [Bacteroidota bacterium]MDP4241960.1 hypothetical protein [Bacteroidota bacterium]MDP4286863.1 hypothetical protein [Bacteroidota bacterium]
MEEPTKPKSLLLRDTEKVLEVISKILMPVLLLVLGTWFNYAMNSNQEKQRVQEQKQADEQRKSALVESYIKHLTSENPMERNLALRIITLESDQFDVRLVNLVSAYASVATPSDRITALEVLSHASRSNNPAVREAATKNISTVPTIPVSETDTKDVQQKAAIINQALGTAKLNPNVVSKANDLSKALGQFNILK